MAVANPLQEIPMNPNSINAKPSNALESVQQALSEARDLAIRAEQIVERLLGSVPQQAEANGVSVAPQGLLANMQDDAERTRRFVRDAASSLTRLETVLP
jgi:hypothetical protein